MNKYTPNEHTSDKNCPYLFHKTMICFINPTTTLSRNPLCWYITQFSLILFLIWATCNILSWNKICNLLTGFYACTSTATSIRFWWIVGLPMKLRNLQENIVNFSLMDAYSMITMSIFSVNKNYKKSLKEYQSLPYNISADYKSNAFLKCLKNRNFLCCRCWHFTYQQGLMVVGKLIQMLNSHIMRDYWNFKNFSNIILSFSIGIP